MIHQMNSKKLPCAISVDGPRGPARESKKGIAVIAKNTHSYILPGAPLSNHYWEIKKSWDKFRIPKPFSKITMFYGKPILVPENLDDEKMSDILNELKSELDRMDREFYSDKNS